LNGACWIEIFVQQKTFCIWGPNSFVHPVGTRSLIPVAKIILSSVPELATVAVESGAAVDAESDCASTAQQQQNNPRAVMQIMFFMDPPR
jgi:hypothetical protein